MAATSNSTGCTPLDTASTRRPPKISLLPSPSLCVKRENSRTRAPRAPSTGASYSIGSFSFSSSPFFAFARSFFPFRFLLFAFARPRRPRRDHHTPSPPVSLGPLGNKCFRISTSNRLSLSNATTTTRDPHRKKERKKRALGSARFEAELWDLDRRRACCSTPGRHDHKRYVRFFVRRAKRQ